MPRWFPLLILPLLILAVGLPLALGSFEPGLPPGPAVEESFATLDPERAQRVILRGTAHYDTTITQTHAATLFRDAETHYLFGFFPEGELQARAIPVLVRSAKPPPSRVSYETMTIEGVLGPLTFDKVSPSHEATLSSRTAWYFTEHILLLEALAIVNEDGRWESPALAEAEGGP